MQNFCFTDTYKFPFPVNTLEDTTKQAFQMHYTIKLTYSDTGTVDERVGLSGARSGSLQQLAALGSKVNVSCPAVATQQDAVARCSPVIRACFLSLDCNS